MEYVVEIRVKAESENSIHVQNTKYICINVQWESLFRKKIMNTLNFDCSSFPPGHLTMVISSTYTMISQ